MTNSSSSEAGFIPSDSTKTCAWSALIFLAAVGLFLVFSCTIAPNFELSWHDRQRLGQLALFVLVGIVFAASRARVTDCLQGCSRFSKLALALAVTLGLSSAAVAIASRWAFLEVALTVLTIAFSIGMASMVRAIGQEATRWLTAGAVAVAVAYASVVFARIAPTVLGGETLFVSHLFEGFSNLRFFGQVQSMLIPVLAASVLLAARPAYLRLAIGALVVWWFFVFLASTRGTWLALAVGAAALLIVPAHGRRLFALNAVSAVAGAAVYAGFVFAMQVIGNVAEPIVRSASSLGSTHDRLFIWKRALDMAWDYPWLGVGPMHFAFERNPYGAHPHNFLLQWLAEWGIPATLCFVVVIFAAMRGWARFARSYAGGRERGTVIAALTASVAGAMTQALVDGVFVMPYSQVLLATLCGWMLAIYQDHRGDPVPAAAPSRATGVVVGVCALASVATMAYAIYPELQGLIAWEEATVEARTDDGFSYYFPRFWLQGWIDR